MIQDFAFSCSSYVEYNSMYDALYGKNEKKEVATMKMVEIRFADGEVKSFHTSVLTIQNMIDLAAEGAVVIRFYEG